MTDYPKPDAIVDVVLLTLHQGRLSVFLARRDREPFRGAWALPGGYIHVVGEDGADEDEDAEDTARRVLRQKVGLEPPYLEQLYTFSGRKRDERGWTLSVCHFALVPSHLLAAPPVVETGLFPVDALPEGLPFDHADMIAMAVRRVRGKSSYTSLPLFLLPDEFTMADLQEVYGQVRGERIPPTQAKSFRRKIEDQGFVEEIPGRLSAPRVGRPAQLYRAASDELAQVRPLAPAGRIDSSRKLAARAQGAAAAKED